MTPDSNEYCMKNLGAEDPTRQATRALILVPTRELSEQVSAYLRGLVVYCDQEVTVANLASGTTTHLQRYVVTAGSLVYR